MKFCVQCAGPLEQKIPADDNVVRHVCTKCEYVHYQNPRIVVGCLPLWQDQVLICKRGIEPRIDKWTLPAGFMELKETAEEGAMRETLEEANARVEIQSLHTLYSIPHVGHVYMIFRSRLLDLDFSAGSETTETKLVSIADIPWSEVAFNSIKFSLEKYAENPESLGPFVGNHVRG